MTEIKQALDFNLTKVAGVLISHEHNDHCKAAEDVVKAGINIYCSEGTWQAMSKDKKLPLFRTRIIRSLTKVQIGEFSVMPFDVKHDASEPLGFLIEHPECGIILFITDSYYVSYTFKNLTNIIVEANYCPEIVKKRMMNNTIINKVRNRVIESHMSIDTCISLLKANDLSKVNNIVLTHLSDGNSNEDDFKNRVEAATGKTVSIADKGMKINFNKQPF